MRHLLFITFLVLSFSTLGHGQTYGNGQAQLTQIFLAPGALEKCGPVPNWDISRVNPYSPRFKSQTQAYSKIETYKSVTLACMKTSLPAYRSNGGYGYVVMTAGSQYGFTLDGRAFYLGTSDGQFLRCHNPTLGIWELQIVDETWETPKTTVIKSEPEDEYCLNLPRLTLDEAEEEGYELVKTRKGYRCVKEVKPPKEEPKEEECEDCTAFRITEINFVSKGWGARIPSLGEFLVAAADGGLTSGSLSNKSQVKTGLIGAGLSATKTLTYKVFNPDKNALSLHVNETPYIVRKKRPEIVREKRQTLTLGWVSENMILGKLADGSICFTAYIQNAFSAQTVTIIYRGGKKETIPVKTTPSNPTQGPVRPRRTFFAGTTDQQSPNQNFTNTNTPSVTPTKPQLGRCEQEMNINGKIRIEKVC